MSSSSQRVICSRFPKTTPWPSRSLKAYSYRSVCTSCGVAGDSASEMPLTTIEGLLDDSGDGMCAGGTSAAAASEPLDRVLGSETAGATGTACFSTTSGE